MARLLRIFPLMLSVLLSGCGQVFVGFVWNPNGTTGHISGTVISVQLGFIDDRHGTSATFTAVTLVNGGVSTTMNFCGDQRSLFPMNQFVSVDFHNGPYCSTLTAVSLQNLALITLSFLRLSYVRLEV